MPRPERKYAPIWKELKAAPDHKVECSVHPVHVSRTKKAIIKEKYLDSPTMFLNREEGDNLKLKFFYNAATRILRIELRQIIGIDDMVV